MAGRIQGITVEIGGDTTKLQTALKGVNTEIRNTQSQLRDVDKLLELDYQDMEDKLAHDPEYQHPEPQAFMTAKSYKAKFTRQRIGQIHSDAYPTASRGRCSGGH